MRINSLVLSLFIVSVLIFQYSSFSEDEKIVRMELKLKIGTFDPLYDNEPVPKELRMEKSSYYIVQFKDRIEKDWRFEVEKVARIYRYLPENSYIIKTDNIGYLEKLPFIRWIGLYHPGYKISPQIKNFLKDTYFVTLFDDDWLKVETDKIKEIAFIEGVEWIEKYPEPKLLNDIAARTIDVRQATDGAYSGTSALWSYNPTSDKFEGYPGNNITVAVMDTGVDATHPTFEGRIKKIITYGYGTAGEDGWVGHGTHVSGSVLGNGTWRSADPSGQKGKYAGMAPNAELVMQHLWGWPSPNKATSDAVANGASISSNSWGVQTSPYGSYDSTAQGYDSAVRLPLTVIFAAGNSGSSADTITPPATGKNVITIGATGNDKGGYSSNVVQSFSSRGPTDDGRIKPDLVAPGILIASARSAQRTTNPGYGNPSDDSDGSSYVYMGGTSMSCPIVAGSAAVVIDYYKTVYGITPSPALVKALLINGADPIPGYTYPGNAQGWGMVNIVKSVIQKGSYKIFDDDQKTLLNKDDTSVYTANVLSSEPLKISLVWTDKPASVNANPALVNDLDLIVTSPNGDTYYGNVFSNGESVKGGKADSINNVEGFYLKAPQIGNWTITVTGKNVPLGPQDYAIVISGPILVGRDYIDLSPIEIKFSKTNPVEGEKIGLSLKIKNSGTILANNVGYEMLDTKPDKTTISILKGTITSIGAGEERVIEFQWVAAPRGIHKFKLKVDQLKLIPESIEDNNELTSYITVGYYGLTVYPSVATKNLDPGNSTKYVIAIKNCGTVVDTYNLSFESVPIGWSADVSQKSVTLSSGATANVDITVKAPINALAGEKAKIKLICVSKGNSSYSAEVLTYTTVNQVYGLEIFADKLSMEILPGESAIYNITLRNLGNGNDTFDFTTRKADTDLDWLVKTNMRSAELSPKSEINISMEVTAPKKIVANEAIDVDFLARSSSNIERELKTKTTIGKTYSISISGEGSVAVDPGASFIYNITILNEGNYEEEVSFKLELLEGWESSEIEPIIVQPYNQTKIEVYIETKDIELAGNYNITLYAISKKTHEFTFNVEVKQYYKLELLFQPKKIELTKGENRTCEITVKNKGNGIDKVKVEVTGGYKLTKEYLAIEHWSSNKTELRIYTSNDTKAGNYTITIKAISQGSPNEIKTGSLELSIKEKTIPPPLPKPEETTIPKERVETKEPWFVFIILLVIIFVIAGLGYGIFRAKERLETRVVSYAPRRDEIGYREYAQYETYGMQTYAPVQQIERSYLPEQRQTIAYESVESYQAYEPIKAQPYFGEAYPEDREYVDEVKEAGKSIERIVKRMDRELIEVESKPVKKDTKLKDIIDRLDEISKKE